MSLSQEPVFSLLKEHFVVGWKNIRGADYVGSSHGYTCSQSAVGTTNGAGPRNTQIFVLSPDGIVLHCLPGFWHPDDLAAELQVGRTMHRLWKDDRSLKQRRAMFTRIMTTSLRMQPQETRKRSGWQGFDAQNERQRLKKGRRDTFYYDAKGKPVSMKPINVLVHDRMAARPFVPLRKFDTETFIDYGRPYYDNNARVDGTGVRFGSKGYMASQKRMAERAARRAATKKKVDEYYGKVPKKDSKAKSRKKRAPRRPTSRPTSRPSRRQE